MSAGHDASRSTRRPVIDRLLASREALLAEVAPSPASAGALARLADDAVRTLADSASGSPGAPWAAIALGGYGAERLLPGSDLDLLILSDAPPSRVKPFAEAVFYPLWDSGLAVGHQVRSRKEHVRACAADLATLTASLTGRVVAGDRALGEQLLADVAARAAKARKRVLRELAARPRPGSPYLLEPDLKDGIGGRRDLDELVWTAAVLAGRPTASPAPLGDLGILDADELAAVHRASVALTVARWTLHVTEPHHREILTLEAAEDVPLPPEAIAIALADVAHTLTRVRRRVAGTRAPALPATPEALFRALGEGEGALPLLEEAAWAGVLEPLVPGLGEMMPLRRPGLAHTLTVGAHCLAAAASIADAPARDPFAAEILARLADRRPLLAATLTHDFGKREPGPGHAARGQEDAARACATLGIPEAGVDASVLVREHLLLAEAASRYDADDEDAVLTIAARLGRRELVGPLYMLALADSLATGPGMWSPWRAALTGNLAARLDAALSPDVEGAGIALAAEATRSAALALLAGGDDSQRAFVERAPLRYLASTPPRTVAAHAELAAPLVGRRDLAAAAISISAGPLDASWCVTVATLDRHGLFATLAGVFALSSLSILGAEALPGPGDTAIDVFTVQSATLATVDTATWALFERNLNAALGGKLELEIRLAERRRHYPTRGRTPRTHVSADSAGVYATSLHVETADRVGLLHDLALALATEGLDIRSATVLTHEGVASDTFRVTGPSGGPLTDRAALAKVVHALNQAASGR